MRCLLLRRDKNYAAIPTARLGSRYAALNRLLPKNNSRRWFTYARRTDFFISENHYLSYGNFSLIKSDATILLPFLTFEGNYIFCNSDAGSWHGICIAMRSTMGRELQPTESPWLASFLRVPGMMRCVTTCCASRVFLTGWLMHLKQSQSSDGKEESRLM